MQKQNAVIGFVVLFFFPLSACLFICLHIYVSGGDWLNMHHNIIHACDVTGYIFGGTSLWPSGCGID